MRHLFTAKKIAGVLGVAGVVLVFASGTLAEKKEDSAWLTDFEKAKEQAAEKNRPILADFSGSDWCGWCIRLDKEVFSKKEFQQFAKEELVLLLVDFPRNKEQSRETKQQNQKLAQKYGVRGFPTILLLDADGKELARTGYKRGGAEKYIDHLKELIEKNFEPEKSAESDQASADNKDDTVVVNSNCPIMGTEIDPADVPENLMREFEGEKVGFCCGGCPGQWDELTKEEKRAKLNEVL